MTRYSEHLSHIKNGRNEKLSVANHVLTNEYFVAESWFKLVKNVMDRRILDARSTIANINSPPH